MTILGIDPGIATVGFGVLRAEGAELAALRFGAVRTPAGERLSARLMAIHRDILQLIDTFHPDSIAVEELFFNTNLTTGISVAQGRGVILLAGEERGVPMFEYTPLQIKQSVCGYGRADKRQMMDMVRRTLSLREPARPDDASDALAAAICHARNAASLLTALGGGSPCSTI